MSASETVGAVGVGVIPNRDSFTVAAAAQQFPAPPHSPPKPVVPNMCLAYTPDGTAVYKPVPGSSPPFQTSVEGSAEGGDSTIVAHNVNVNVNSSDPMKRKRGRPRKYGPDGSMSMGTVPAAPTQQPAVNTTAPLPPAAAGAPLPPAKQSSPPSSMKKVRGRPPGSGSSKKQKAEDLGSVGIGFTPHYIIVKAGEDVSAKIMSFSQHGPRAICIIAATGLVSNVTLRQPATSGGTATYEGLFEILCLSGSFLPSEVGGQRSRTGGLSVTLNGPDGRIFGGCVAGLLTAASPVQVIVASFMPDGNKESKSASIQEHLPAALNINPLNATGAISPPSRGTLSESSGGPGSPLNQSSGACNNVNSQGMTSMPWK